MSLTQTCLYMANKLYDLIFVEALLSFVISGNFNNSFKCVMRPKISFKYLAIIKG